MGITIRYTAPVKPGATVAYSVERREDGAYFDFVLCAFRPYKDIPKSATTGAMVLHEEVRYAEFKHAKAGKEYIIRVHDGPGGKPIAELPVTANAGHEQKGYQKEPSYRSGKKFVDGKAIEAKYRLTFHGNDGFTVHTATLWEDGTSSCNCPQWTKKTTRVRGCRHSERALTLTANIDETGEQPEPPAPKGPQGPTPFKRRSRPVDT
jgi:hypothetical protein